MAGIEDFVVEQIINDFQNSPQAPQPPSQAAPPPAMSGPGMTLEEAIRTGNTAEQAAQSSLFREGQYAHQAIRGLPPGAVEDPRSPQGFTFANPADRERYAQFSGNLNAAAAGGAQMDAALRERDQQRFKILQGIHGLDPQIQAQILKRLGIDPGAVKSQIQQQKEILQYKNQLERPQQETANAIKMLLATQGGQQHAAELAQKIQAQQQEQASRAQTQNIQLMRVLAALMQNDASGKLQQTLGPLLMQMLQGAGVNLAPATKPTGAQAGGRAGIKITRE